MSPFSNNANSIEGEIYMQRLAGYVRSNEASITNGLQAFAKVCALDPSLQLPTKGSARPIRLSFTLHHLYYLCERIQNSGLTADVGPLNMKLENPNFAVPTFVSFLDTHNRGSNDIHSFIDSSDTTSITSMSSVKSIVTSASMYWRSFGFSKDPKIIMKDLEYLCSVFQELPCLILSPKTKIYSIANYEEYPFDTSIPMHLFKNLQVLEITNYEPNEVYGWNFLSECLQILVIKNCKMEDLGEVLYSLVLDDEDGRTGFFNPTGTNGPRKHRSATLPERKYRHRRQYSDTDVIGSPPTVYFESLLNDPVVIPVSGSPRNSAYYNGARSPLSNAGLQTSSNYTYFSLRPEPVSSTSSTTKDLSYDTKGRRSSEASALSPSNSMSSTRRVTSRSTHSSRVSVSTAVDDFPQSRHGHHHSMYNFTIPGEHAGRNRNSFSRPALDPAKWSRLKQLTISETRVSYIPDDILRPFGNLAKLDLSHNNLSELPIGLKYLTGLKFLNLSHNRIQNLDNLLEICCVGMERKGVSGMSGLVFLDLSYNKVDSLAHLEMLVSLEKLDIRRNSLLSTAISGRTNARFSRRSSASTNFDLSVFRPIALSFKQNAQKLTSIYVSGNSNLHKTHRIDLFNLFNGCGDAKRTLNLTIDNSKPGYFENSLLLTHESCIALVAQLLAVSDSSAVSSSSVDADMLTKGLHLLKLSLPSSASSYRILPPSRHSRDRGLHPSPIIISSMRKLPSTVVATLAPVPASVLAPNMNSLNQLRLSPSFLPQCLDRASPDTQSPHMSPVSRFPTSSQSEMFLHELLRADSLDPGPQKPNVPRSESSSSLITALRSVTTPSLPSLGQVTSTPRYTASPVA
ncbi:hypothetical protein BABINDRAFT_161559 [Babjeviella inositovora NRRL Y-12698]|uniref:Leucine-rich repeat-containing protein n=1 Tax=Babjeviella inositovora NRRL Y-12698 TaxID=984486 RepID=A0A1E3QQA3_9ASCO|nr:uncharacterized protein BABINDRAFT_161559 [Babjeviella inositovora NRRL Y-12698]ODQ79886.1 hypothetical protein BABINDRAFT_161559 [Babjeviella inositovora NRRL Y-12698]